jgi:hypothetical protein
VLELAEEFQVSPPHFEPPLDQACQDSAEHWPERYFQEHIPMELEEPVLNVSKAHRVRLGASTGEGIGNLLLRLVLWMAETTIPPAAEFVAPRGTTFRRMKGGPFTNVHNLGDSDTTSYWM